MGVSRAPPGLYGSLIADGSVFGGQVTSLAARCHSKTSSAKEGSCASGSDPEDNSYQPLVSIETTFSIRCFTSRSHKLVKFTHRCRPSPITHARASKPLSAYFRQLCCPSSNFLSKEFVVNTVSQEHVFRPPKLSTKSCSLRQSQCTSHRTTLAATPTPTQSLQTSTRLRSP